MTKQELDNILVRQKDKIIHLIDHDHITKAIAALHVIKELWIASNYEYKLKELRDRMRIRLKNNKFKESYSPSRTTHPHCTCSYDTQTNQVGNICRSCGLLFNKSNYHD